MEQRPCVYDEVENEHEPGTVQCPKCGYWYCAECSEMFLDRVPDTDQYVMRGAILPAPICPECHYKTFWVPALQRDRAW